MDKNGNLFVTGPKGIWVWDAKGNHLGTIVMPEQPANLTWGDQNYSTLLHHGDDVGVSPRNQDARIRAVLGALTTKPDAGAVPYLKLSRLQPVVHEVLSTLLTFETEDCRSVWKREAEDIASRGDRHVLYSVHRIGHRRCTKGLASIEVPESLAGLGIDRFQGVGIVGKEYQSARRGECASP